MPRPTDRQHYDRAVATLAASWEAIASGSAGARLLRLRGALAAVFPNEPESAIYNNAVFERELSAVGRAAAIEAVEAAYAAAAVERYAAWVHESDIETASDLDARGYAIAESTRVMGISLDELPPQPTATEEVGLADWATYLGHLQSFGLPATLLSGVDPDAFHVLAGRRDGEVVATALAFDHAGDCGIFNTSTSEPARRRGLATALTARHLQEAAARGCETATLLSTPMAEGVYSSVGFEDLGRFLEYVPGT